MFVGDVESRSSIFKTDEHNLNYVHWPDEIIKTDKGMQFFSA
jgi:hypothetical protein